MAQQIINVGAAANDGTGDKLRIAGQKINGNFNELYAAIGGNPSNVTLVAGSIAQVNAVAGDLPNINTVAGSIGNLNLVAPSIANVNTVAGSIGNVNIVAPSIANVNTVAGAIANVNAVAGDLPNIDTIAVNIGAVNTCSANMPAILDAPNQATAAANSAAQAQVYAATPKYGGKVGGWPDTFFRHSQIGVNFLGRKRWVSQVAGGTDYSSLSLVPNSKYDGYALRKTVPGAAAQCGPLIRLDEIGAGGAVVGDTITIPILVRGAAGRTAKCRVQGYSALGVPGGFAVLDMINDAGGVGVVMDGVNYQRLHITYAVANSSGGAAPVAVGVFPFSTDMVAGESFDVVALWPYKGIVTDGPQIPDYIGDDPYFALYNSTREYTGGLEQLFDAATMVLNGYQLNDTTGTITADANSDTAIIPLPDLTAGAPISIAGLQPNTSHSRAYAFFSAKPTAFDPTGTPAAKISGTVINATLNSTLTKFPAGAKYLAVSMRQQNTNPLDTSTVVVCARATAPSGAVAFAKHVARVDSVPPQNATPRPPYSGGVLMLFGDSITATNNVDSASYVYPDGFSTNWPDLVVPRLMPDAVYSFARSGAELAANGSLVNMQKFGSYDAVNGWKGQVGAAVAYATANGITPRTILTALGTNDQAANSGALGDFNTAMGKNLAFDGGGVPTTTLDQTLSLENMRLCLMYLRWAFPNAVFLFSLPIQRVSIALTTMQTWGTTLRQMAEACGCTVINTFAESGILQQFENNGSAGRDLLDGIHPNSTTGRTKMASTILGRTINRLMGDGPLL